jgi:hypothetical protein
VLNTLRIPWFSLALPHTFSELGDIQLTFGCLFNSFGDALKSLGLIFEGLGSRFENQ